MDLISRQAAIDAVNNYLKLSESSRTVQNMASIYEVLQSVPPAQSDLISKIQNGIKVTDADDAYSCGMRNGMRWCMSLIDDKEPLYENCPSAEPEIIRCKNCKHYTLETGDRVFALGYCPFIKRHLVMSEGFCAWAERRNDG